jgi:hypothetical protein
MMAKTTIAIVEATETAGIEVAKRLALHDYRLLLISGDEIELTKLAARIIQIPTAEVETINCLKEGCWEADIIVIAASKIPVENIATKIRDVATQKIIVEIVTGSQMSVNETLHLLLPYSKIVTALVDTADNRIIITGANYDAVQHIKEIAGNIGFNLKQPFS